MPELSQQVFLTPPESQLPKKSDVFVSEDQSMSILDLNDIFPGSPIRGEKEKNPGVVEKQHDQVQGQGAMHQPPVEVINPLQVIFFNNC